MKYLFSYSKTKEMWCAVKYLSIVKCSLDGKALNLYSDTSHYFISISENRSSYNILLIYRVWVWKDEKVVWMDGSDASAQQWMYLMPPNCTLENG